MWKKFINPNDKDYRGLMDEWKGRIRFDHRENVCVKLDWSRDDYFSDERLLRRLIHINPVSKFEMERGYKDFLEATIDRHTFDSSKQEWIFDREKLKSGGYVNAHGIRPFKKYEKLYQPLINYINENY